MSNKTQGKGKDPNKIVIPEDVKTWFGIRRGRQVSLAYCETIAQHINHAVKMQGDIRPLAKNIPKQAEIKDQHRKLVAAIETVVSHCRSELQIPEATPEMSEVYGLFDDHDVIADRDYTQAQLELVIDVLELVKKRPHPLKWTRSHFAAEVKALAALGLLALEHSGRPIHSLSVSSPLVRFIQRALNHMQGTDTCGAATIVSMIKRDDQVAAMLEHGSGVGIRIESHVTPDYFIKALDQDSYGIVVKC